MLNYQSVRSSEPQIRSNPALRNANPGFQKRLSTLLEPTPIPFPTFQILKDTNQSILEHHPFYAWVRPAKLRSQLLVLHDTLPVLLADPRDERKLHTIRIPFDKRRVQHSGAIVLEGAWDPQDHILWIWDVLVWERQVVWSTMPYSKRWEILKLIVDEILDCGHPMSDAEVKLPTWESLEAVSKRDDLDPAMTIEFQPEKAGQRKFLFLIRDTGTKFKPTSHHERKMVADAAGSTNVRASSSTPAPVHVPKPIQEPAPTTVHAQTPSKEPPSSNKPTEHARVGKLAKDPYSKLPDTYRITSIEGADLGLAAIRSIEISKRLREVMKTTPSVMVDIQWFEPFQKYDVRKLHL
jgi:hypothetical protein